mmetsp:Transcript_36149/g.41303  ORF Transcript_36149/g.41303 Transcript_36149/m.41303 type:complete len:224 (-) Transcript_36149:494-1165(-)
MLGVEQNDDRGNDILDSGRPAAWASESSSTYLPSASCTGAAADVLFATISAAAISSLSEISDSDLEIVSRVTKAAAAEAAFFAACASVVGVSSISVITSSDVETVCISACIVSISMAFVVVVSSVVVSAAADTPFRRVFLVVPLSLFVLRSISKRVFIVRKVVSVDDTSIVQEASAAQAFVPSSPLQLDARPWMEVFAFLSKSCPYTFISSKLRLADFKKSLP